MESNAALLRVASLSVEEISRGDFGADRLRESFIRQAIGLAAGHDLLNGSSQRIEEAIARYVTRMGGRATPFGLLAGTAFVNTGTTRRLELSDRCSHQAFIRIDMAVLELLVAAYCPSASTTLLRPGEEPLALALSALRQAGATPQAEALHELASSVCGPRPVAQISMARLEAAWHAAAATLPELAGIHEKKRFHVDLDLLLAADQVEERLAENLDLTLRRLQLLFHSSDPLQEFREEFRSRFEDGEVPLDEVLNFKQGLMEKSVTITSPLADRAGVERRRKPTSELTVPDISIAAYDHWRSTGRPYDLADQPVAQHGVARSVQAALIGSQAEGHDAVLVSGQERSPWLPSHGSLCRDRTVRPCCAAGSPPVSTGRKTPSSPSSSIRPRAESATSCSARACTGGAWAWAGNRVPLCSRSICWSHLRAISSSCGMPRPGGRSCWSSTRLTPWTFQATTLAIDSLRT